MNSLLPCESQKTWKTMASSTWTLKKNNNKLETTAIPAERPNKRMEDARAEKFPCTYLWGLAKRKQEKAASRLCVWTFLKSHHHHHHLEWRKDRSVKRKRERKGAGHTMTTSLKWWWRGLLWPSVSRESACTRYRRAHPLGSPLLTFSQRQRKWKARRGRGKKIVRPFLCKRPAWITQRRATWPGNHLRAPHHHPAPRCTTP